MAGVTGIEPATCGFVDHRSIHLSYTPKFDSTTDFLAAHPERFDDLVRSKVVQHTKCCIWCRIQRNAPFIWLLSWTEVGLKWLTFKTSKASPTSGHSPSTAALRDKLQILPPAKFSTFAGRKMVSNSR
jgi:hypothetical protein